MTDITRRLRVIERAFDERAARITPADPSLTNQEFLNELFDVAGYPLEWQAKAAPIVERIRVLSYGHSGPLSDELAELYADLLAIGLYALNDR